MNVLEIQNVTKIFTQGKKTFTAVDDVSFTVEKGECVGLVGESGCGKSTLAKLITRLENVSSGNILVAGENITKQKRAALRESYRNMQMVFQNPTDSFNPRVKLGSSIAEVPMNFGMSREQAKERMVSLLDLVGLKREYANRYPHQISGGECQRAAIARAIALEPDLLICDEATSALDVSVQAQIVALIQKLQRELTMSYLFISHDLALVQSICHRVVVMHRGRIVESGDTQKVIQNPAHPYTKLLLSSVFPVDPDTGWQIPDLPQQLEEEGEACKFWQRCPHATESCKQKRPELRFVEENHWAACPLSFDSVEVLRTKNENSCNNLIEK